MIRAAAIVAECFRSPASQEHGARVADAWQPVAGALDLDQQVLGRVAVADLECDVQIVYDDGNAFMSGPVVDISESGVFIETVMPLEPGTNVRLTPLLPEEVGLFEVGGVVVRKNDYDLDNHFDRTPGMGVRFTEISPDALEAIRKLFERGKKR